MQQTGELEFGLAGAVHTPGIRAVKGDGRRDVAAVNSYGWPVTL